MTSLTDSIDTIEQELGHPLPEIVRDMLLKLEAESDRNTRLQLWIEALWKVEFKRAAMSNSQSKTLNNFIIEKIAPEGFKWNKK